MRKKKVNADKAGKGTWGEERRCRPGERRRCTVGNTEERGKSVRWEWHFLEFFSLKSLRNFVDSGNFEGRPSQTSVHDLGPFFFFFFFSGGIPFIMPSTNKTNFFRSVPIRQDVTVKF
jgi:hypothetical protein